jgi:hypothetical protein
MLTRVAIFEGVIESGGEAAFFANVRERLEPIWASFPRVLDVRLLRTCQADPGAIPIVMVLEMDFADLNAIQDALDSDIKLRAHAATLEVLKPFSGRFFHFITESSSIGAN